MLHARAAQFFPWRGHDRFLRGLALHYQTVAMDPFNISRVSLTLHTVNHETGYET